MSPRLSKSRFQAGLQCRKRLWLAVNARELATPTSPSKQHMFDTGHVVGQLAQTRYPGGVLVEEDHTQSQQALETTRALLDRDDLPGALYEAAIEYRGVMVRADVLARVGENEWDMIEVKSGTKVKPEHVTDAAVQLWVLRGAGLNVRRAHLMHLDRSYVHDGGAYDVHRLFAAQDVTEDAAAFMPHIPGLVDSFMSMLASPEPPQVGIGSHCRNPYDCEFADHCHAFLPERPVTKLPRISERTLNALLVAGIHGIDDVPLDFPGLTAAQRTVCQLVQSGEARFDGDVGRSLAALQYPVHFLDFETIMPALPLRSGVKPYQQLPFQWSIHTLHASGELTHAEYLHLGGDDPRPPLAKSMLAALGTQGTIVTYTPFERTRIRDLAAALPEYASALAALEPRLFDLERVVASHVRHPACLGATSIKVVLPALVPELSYDGLGIHDGNMASVLYLKAITGQLDDDTRERVHADLLEYCGLDTLAMVRLLEVLRSAAGAHAQPHADNPGSSCNA